MRLGLAHTIAVAAGIAVGFFVTQLIRNPDGIGYAPDGQAGIAATASPDAATDVGHAADEPFNTAPSGVGPAELDAYLEERDFSRDAVIGAALPRRSGGPADGDPEPRFSRRQDRVVAALQAVAAG